MVRSGIIFYVVLAVACSANIAQADGPYFSEGIKIGEVTPTSAIVWTRLTTVAQGGIGELEDAAPGMPGDVRLTYQSAEGSVVQTDWMPVDPDRDHTVQIHLKYLEPATDYALKIESRDVDGNAGATFEGKLKTAPSAESTDKLQLAVVTCQSLRSNDAGNDGFHTYRVLESIRPDLFVNTGDIVYYDKIPFSRNAAQARAKWSCMYSMPSIRAFHSIGASYFIKDDHDTLKNDCWEGQTYGDLTWEEGLAIFREQVPMGEKTYRTYRWGKDLQIWLTENRDFRSPNTMKDGPEKTIWGAKQREWLIKSMKASDATFKLLISPGAVVGPDKRGKNDNHANAGFTYEGTIARKLIADLPGAFVICGDRHWQYHSVDPKTGANEFGCGPISDLHTYGGNPGYQPAMHKYFDKGGGFLLVTVERKDEKPQITFQHIAPVVNPDGELKVRNSITFGK